MKILKVAVFIFAYMICVASAMADKLCLQTTVNKRTLKVTHKKVVAAVCPKGYTELADTGTFQGPQGPAGVPGKTFDISTCYSKAGANDSVVGVALTEVTCNDVETEFMLAEGIEKTRMSPIIAEKQLTLDSTSKIPVGVQYITGYLSGSTPYTQVVTIVCCKRP